MITTANINGKEKVVLVLGNRFDVEPEDYAKALFETLEAALLNPDVMKGYYLEGEYLFSYIKLLRHFVEKPKQEGGTTAK